jgi:hypothetical protein
MSEPLIEILYFDGCPNHPAAVELLERVGRDLAVKLELRHIEVPDAEAARRQRFLGSPTIRVDGRDVEPGAEQRSDYAYGCRVYRTESGFSGQPDERWLRGDHRRARGPGQLKHAPRGPLRTGRGPPSGRTVRR